MKIEPNSVWESVVEFVVMALIGFCLAMMFASSASAAEGPPGGPSRNSRRATVTVKNASNGHMNVTIAAKDATGEPVSGASQNLALKAGEVYTTQIEFDGGSEWVVDHFDVYRQSVLGTVVGASIIYDSGSSSGELLMGKIFYNSASETAPYPVFTFTPKYAELLPEGNKTLWKLSDESLTGNLYREGVDKLIDAVGKSGGGGSGDVGDNVTNVADLQMNLYTAIPTNTALGNASNTALTTFTEAYNTQVDRQTSTNGGIGNPTAPSADSSADDFWTVQIPKGNGQYIVWDLNPTHVPHISEVFAWVKLLITVLILGLFEWWAWEEFQKLLTGVTILQQSRGNPVVGGTGGQATALVNATLWAVIITSVPAAYFAIVSGCFLPLAGLVSGVNNVSVAPTGTSTAFAQSWWLITLVIPWSVVVSVFAQAWVIKKGGLFIHGACAMTIRFLVG